MVRRFKRLALGVAVAFVLLLVAGLWRLFAVRFAMGEEYPAYSTLNAGPLGTRAIYEALAAVGRPEAERNFLPLVRFRPEVGTTLVLAGAGEGFFGAGEAEFFDSLERLMDGGLQVVVLLNGRAVPAEQASTDPVFNPWGRGSGWPPRGGMGAGEQGAGLSAGERWGFQFQLEMNPEQAPRAGQQVVAEAGGPPSWPRWFSVWRWAELGPWWEVLATVGGRPVLIRREFGRGSLTLASDTVFLSNEALWRAPEPSFLRWLLGGQPRVVFDETQHGTVSDPGVMYLMRRYRLLGFLAGAAVLMGLYVWRAGAALVPVHESLAEPAGRPLAGADGMAGLVNLLRQAVGPNDLLRVCFAEWAGNPLIRRRVPARVIAAAGDLVAAAGRAGRRDPAATYREVTELVAAGRAGRRERPEAGADPG